MNPGASLGPYRIDRELGSGGMGKVYAATDESGGTVALKVVHPHLLETPGFFKRFLREAQVGQSIRHDNVVRTLDCDQDFSGGKPQCFLVMEYVEGQTLSALLRELVRVPEELCRHVAREICKGLAAVHEAGVVHRDLKPDNVLITPEHVVKIMDLGVAQVADESLRLSREGAFVGSVEYAAPEQFKGGDVDGRTDLHALGVLLYELASGAHPYRGGGFHEVLTRVCESDPRRLGEVNPQLSAFFEEVVHTLLVKDPRGRFASATQLLDVLEEGEDSPWWHDRARKLQADTKRPIRRIRIPRETAVYGRDAELTRLHEVYEKAKGGDGQVVLIEGEAGIGKSRLVDELVARLQAEGEDVNFLFGGYPPGGAATANGAFSAAFHQQFGEAGAAPHLTQTPLLVPAFDALLRGDAPPPGAQALSKDSVGTCFVRATQSLAAERPTLLLIDDLHFAPDEARALFSLLALSTPGHRVLLIGSTRPGASDEWRAGLTRLPDVTFLELSRLGAKDLVRLLTESLGSRHLAEDLAGRIAAKSDGNPFFTFEILRGLRDGNFITRGDDGTWASTRVIDEIEIPSSVLDLVNARVSGLTEDERALLDVAACCGYEFDPSLVGEVLGLARIPALRAFGQVERRHRLVRSSGRHYVFDHHQVQEALYSSLNEQLREEYHAALAETLEARTGALDKELSALDGALCVELCEQYLHGARGDAAHRYVRAAVDHLVASHLPVEAVALTQRALALPELLKGDERVEMLLLMAQQLDTLGRRDAHRATVEEAAALADVSGDPRLRAHAHWALGHCLERGYEHDAALAQLDRAREMARDAGDTEREMAALGCRSLVLMHVARYAEAEQGFRTQIEHYHDSGDRIAEGSAWTNLGTLLDRLGKLAEAKQCHERHLQLCREAGNRAREMGAALNLGTCLAREGRIDEAQELFELSLERARQQGNRYIETVAIGNIGAVHAQRRNFDEALACYERHAARCREIGLREGEAMSERNLGQLEWVQGRLEAACAHFVRRAELARAMNQRWGEAEGLSFQCSPLVALGRSEAACEKGRRAVAIWEDEGNQSAEVDARFRLATALCAAGDNDGADACLRKVLAVVEESGDANGRARALLVLADMADDRGDADGARALLEEVCELARAGGDAVADSSARWHLGLLPRGSLEEAARALAEHEQLLPLTDQVAAYARLWTATGDDVHLRRGRELLDRLHAANAPGLHDDIHRALRLSPEFLAACHDTGANEGGAREDSDPPGTESVTRVG